MPYIYCNLVFPMLFGTGIGIFGVILRLGKASSVTLRPRWRGFSSNCRQGYFDQSLLTLNVACFSIGTIELKGKRACHKLNSRRIQKLFLCAGSRSRGKTEVKHLSIVI